MKLELEISEETVTVIADGLANRLRDLFVAEVATSEYMDAREAAAYLRCPRQRIYDLTSSRSLPYFKFGGRLLFSKRDIDAWMAESRVEPRTSFDPPRLPERSLQLTETKAVTRRSDEKPKKRERPLPPPLSFSDAQKTSSARALGLTRAEFDELTPGEFDRLWKERTGRFDSFSEETKKTRSLPTTPTSPNSWR